MPLADIYATSPLKNEKPLDYWISLHNAVDIAGVGLKRQGKLDGPHEGGTSGGPCVMSPGSDDIDLASFY